MVLIDDVDLDDHIADSADIIAAGITTWSEIGDDGATAKSSDGVGTNLPRRRHIGHGADIADINVDIIAANSNYSSENGTGEGSGTIDDKYFK